MVDSRIYSVIVYRGDSSRFYGTFSNRKNMLDSIREHIDLNGAFIEGSRKRLDITPVTIANGFVGSGLTIMKEDESTHESKPYIKVLMHKINAINPYFKKKEKEDADKRTDD